MSIASGSDSFLADYSAAATPPIQSQLVGGARTDLFSVKTRADGNLTNSKFKLGQLFSTMVKSEIVPYELAYFMVKKFFELADVLDITESTKFALLVKSSSHNKNEKNLA